MIFNFRVLPPPVLMSHNKIKASNQDKFFAVNFGNRRFDLGLLFTCDWSILVELSLGDCNINDIGWRSLVVNLEKKFCNLRKLDLLDNKIKNVSKS